MLAPRLREQRSCRTPDYSSLKSMKTKIMSEDIDR